MTSLDLLARSLESWSAFAGRRLGEEAQAAWVREFVNIDPAILQPALDKVSKTAKRMPWPGDLTEAIRLVREERNFGQTEGKWKLDARPAEDTDSGRKIRILIDNKTNEKLYRAEDCPEGRIFLEYLRNFKEIAKNKNEQQLIEERNRQVAEIGKYQATDEDIQF